MIRAKIIEDGGHWLRIERDDEEGADLPIQGDEVEAILEACLIYLKINDKDA